ncbi:MAG: hypothetical protein MK008_13150 [Bdellovibrionales bacterium]|nr:hypothetical protein [Bdellovibrionales bacterium]
MIKKLILSLSAIFVLTACSEVQKIDNGEIPQEYINEIQPFLGSWSGSFNNHMGELELSLNDSNQLIVEFYDSQNNDFIPGCKVSFGLLKEVEFKEKNDQIRIHRATFDFDTNRCSRSILGQQIHFYFNKAQNLANIELLQRQWRDYECRIVGYDPNGAPIRECQHTIREQHLYGSFSLSEN